MRVLLDTHTLYWFVDGDPRLSPTARTFVQNASNEVLVSPLSFWEDCHQGEHRSVAIESTLPTIH